MLFLVPVSIVRVIPKNKHFFIIIISITFIIFIFTSDGHRATIDEDITSQEALHLVTLEPHPNYVQGVSRVFFEYPVMFPPETNTREICKSGLICSYSNIGHSVTEVPFIAINHYLNILTAVDIWELYEYDDPNYAYWKNTLNLFNNFENKNVLNNFSKKFFYFGILSCIFLILHASLLGLDIDTKFFKKIRKLIIILFIIFEITAQIFLTINILKFKNKIKKYISPLVLYIKVIFVSVLFLTTLISFGILAIGDPSTEFKHILEWNYFSFLLLYYLLSTLLWKTKNPVHTPEGV